MTFLDDFEKMTTNERAVYRVKRYASVSIGYNADSAYLTYGRGLFEVCHYCLMIIEQEINAGRGVDGAIYRIKLYVDSLIRLYTDAPELSYGNGLFVNAKHVFYMIDEEESRQ